MDDKELIDRLCNIVAEHSQFTTWTVSTPHLRMLVQEAVEEEREACAKEAESLWQHYHDTKTAHERLSPEPFMPGRFGFDQSTIQQSRRIADAIRARGQA